LRMFCAPDRGWRRVGETRGGCALVCIVDCNLEPIKDVHETFSLNAISPAFGMHGNFGIRIRSVTCDMSALESYKEPVWVDGS
jgi:hypothetical protein